MIFATASRKKVQELGIKPDNAVKLLNKVLTASTECERANEAAEDILKLRDGEKLKVIDEKITAIDKILSRRESLISERKKGIQHLLLIFLLFSSFFVSYPYLETLACFLRVTCRNVS